MNEPKETPSRLLKTLAAGTRGLLWLLWAAWLCFFVAWGALHGWIVPRIADYRPRIEAELGKAVGMPVRIGSITARSGGLVPSFSLGDVQLLDAEGRTALRLPLVVAALSPRSLWNRGFEQLYLDAPELDVRRTADGRILVAGLDVERAHPHGGGSAADWLFTQTEVVIRNGTLRWTDEQRAAPPLALSNVDLLLRNRPWRHALRIDATPPAEWGERFQLAGRFRQPLLAGRNGRWQDWVGQLYGDFGRIDLSRLGQYVDTAAVGGIALQEARGAVRVWTDVDHARITGGMVDVALPTLGLQAAAPLQPLALTRVQGRFTGHRRLAGTQGFDLAVQGLQFDAGDALHWKGGSADLRYTAASDIQPARGELRADGIDLGALATLAARLPVGDGAHRLLADHAPTGLLEKLQARWEGDGTALRSYQATGRASRLGVEALAAPASAQAAAVAEAVAVAARADAVRPAGTPPTHVHVHPPAGTPGVRNAAVDFDLSHAGGKAQVAIDDGALEFPGVFEEPRVPIAMLRAEARWKIDGRAIAVEVPQLRFSNADAAGEAQARWHTADATPPSAGTTGTPGLPHDPRFPGVLDLTGSLQRADGTRVHRYLPQVIPQEVRHYVRDAVQAGSASGVQFKVRGDLHHMPFTDPKQGDFRIAARIRDAHFAYVPTSIQPAGEAPWQVLSPLSAELVFERNGMEIRNGTGRIGLPGRTSELRVTRADARIPDLSHAVVEVKAEAQGPLAEMLEAVNGSPVATLTSGALQEATATGPAELALGLQLPLADMRHARIQGRVVLGGNDLRLAAAAPPMTRARGTVAFTETGFTISNAQARMLGGESRIEGSMRTAGAAAPHAVLPAIGPAARPAARPATPALPADAVLAVRAQGTVSAEGLRAAPELGLVARLAEHAQGSTDYSASIGLRQGRPEVTLASSLQGLALDLPAPVGKAASASLPLRFENTVLAAGAGTAPGGSATRDRVLLELGRVAAVEYERDISGAMPVVLRGGIGIGLDEGDHAPVADQGVAASVRLGALDIDAWDRVVSGATGSSRHDRMAAPHRAGDTPQAGAEGYLPDTLAVRAESITFQGRTLHNVVAGGSRSGPVWRANVETDELNGYVEYRQAADAVPSRVFARLARLRVPESSASEVESLLDDGTPGADPASLPALDIVVDDFELKGRALGRLEVDALHRAAADDGAHEWHLNKLNLSLPEASFAATGNWRRTGEGAARARRTAMQFRLDIRDAGQLLGRFGMPGVVRRGAGRLQGSVGWDGSPFGPDYPSMAGQLNLAVESGQFLKADPGLAKLLGVLSLQSLPRRLALDFRDVFSEGFAFDFVRGDVKIDSGIARTNNLQMKGVNAAVLMDGQADLAHETQNLRVVVVPEINAGTASLVAAVINPAVGLGTFLAQVFLRGPLIEAATQEFHITGGWADPKIAKLSGRERLGRSTPPAEPQMP